MHDKKLPGLDGLRAVAVALVLLFHQYVLPVGWVGVQIFFVLSGYLITRLLERARAQSLGGYLRQFYGRRALRIFPLYYAVIALFSLAALRGSKLEGLREGLPYAATYTYNFWYATHARGYSMLITHFWTLCVEEQFYLVWPFLIYFTPPRARKALLLAIIAAGPLLRAAGAWYLSRPGATQLFDANVALDVLTPTQLDAFAAGAFVALYPPQRAMPALALGSFVWLAAGIGLIVHNGLPWASFGYPIGMGAGFGFLWGYSLINACSALLIDCLVRRKFLPGLFEARPLAYLGRISYGLYVIHYPVQEIVDKALPHARVSLRIAVQVAITVALASVSFHFWEAPFLRLKDRWFKGLAPVPAARAA
jgi:peptidoglycan/LPS O-acetylase OafA/YrhL